MPIDPSDRARLTEICEKLVALLLNKRPAVFFIGAGCSAEYGVPTTFDLARSYLLSDKGGLTESERAGLSALEDRDVFERFLEKFHRENSITIEWDFFKQLVEDAVRRVETPPLTYEMLIDLWRLNYIRFIVTTNFDTLIEETAGRDDLAVLDYSDLNHPGKEFPDRPMRLIKISGDIERSTMLWTTDDFQHAITETVVDWLIAETSRTPLVLVGYRANEPELGKVFEKHVKEMFSVFPAPLETAPKLAAISESKAGNYYHVPATASAFLATLTETLHLRDPGANLLFSFGALRERLIAKTRNYPDSPDLARFVRRTSLDSVLDEVGSSPEKQVLTLIGPSGHGKSHWLMYRALTSDEDTAIAYIRAADLPPDGLDAWFRFVRRLSLEKACDLCVARRKRFLIVLDELNVISDVGRAQMLLAQIAMLSERYAGKGIGWVVTSRPEYWRFELPHRAWKWKVNVEPYTEEEAFEGLRKSGIDIERDEFRRHPANEILRIPIFHRFLAELEYHSVDKITYLELFEKFFDSRIADAGASRIIRKLCREMAERQAVAPKEFRDALSDRDREYLDELISNRTVTEDLLRGGVGFVFDAFGEYAFARVHLRDVSFSDPDAKPSSPSEFVKARIDEWRAVPSQRLAYKIHLLCAIRLFILLLDEEEIMTLLTSNDPNIAQLTREAIFLRRDLVFRPEFTSDPFLLSMSLLKPENDSRVLDALIADDVSPSVTFSLNIAGKLFPRTLLRIVREAAEEIGRDGRPMRGCLRVVIHGLVIYFMRNAVSDNRRSYIAPIMDALRRCDRVYLADVLDEVLLESSHYLLYGHRESRISDISELPAELRDSLIDAVKGSILDLTSRWIGALIDHNMVSWLVVMFLMLRDRADTRLPAALEEIFGRGDALSQDFVLTVCGHLAKLSPNWEPVLREFTLRMQTMYDANFHPDLVDPEDHYDPLVPWVSTRLINAQTAVMEVLGLDLSDPRYHARLERLLYKFAVDYPAETLRTIYELRRAHHLNIYAEFGRTLATIRRFHPQTFWRLTREYRIEDYFDARDTEWEPRALRQVRDCDWFRVFANILSEESTTAAVTGLLLAALRAKSFHNFLLASLTLE